MTWVSRLAHLQPGAAGRQGIAALSACLVPAGNKETQVWAARCNLGRLTQGCRG